MEAESKNQTRIFEMRLPITWLVTISLPILWAAVQLYFTVGALKETVVELRSTVGILSKSATDTQRELSLLAYRVDAVERAIRKDQPNEKG